MNMTDPLVTALSDLVARFVDRGLEIRQLSPDSWLVRVARTETDVRAAYDQGEHLIVSHDHGSSIRKSW